MRFSTSQSNFIEAFNRIAPAVPSKSTLPILSNILLQLEGNRLRMVATDLEVSVLTEIEVHGQEDGALSVPAKKIGDISRELEGLDLECWMDENNHLLMNAGAGSYKVPGISALEFPNLPEIEESAKVTLSTDKMDGFIRRLTFAVSKDELRPALTGVFFQLRPNEIRGVATDGHRLVRIVDQSFQYDGDPRELIFPVKALEMVRRNLPEEGDVEINIGANQVMIKLEDATLFSRLIEGKYPHYESVIPQNIEDRLIVGTEDLIRAVKRAAIFSNPISRQVIFKVEAEKLEITAEDIELGGQGKEVIVASYNGSPKEIGYNANYILEILKQIETDELRMDVGGTTQAAIIKPTEPAEGEDFLMLIMPVRLN
ncbi:DNA polymerase III subunit beta [bacterium]|nr:DNA polymerase III subunit beta [bacterium]